MPGCLALKNFHIFRCHLCLADVLATLLSVAVWILRMLKESDNTSNVLTY